MEPTVLLLGWLLVLMLSSAAAVAAAVAAAALTFLVNGFPSALVMAPFNAIHFRH